MSWQCHQRLFICQRQELDRFVALPKPAARPTEICIDRIHQILSRPQRRPAPVFFLFFRRQFTAGFTFVRSIASALKFFIDFLRDDVSRDRQTVPKIRHSRNVCSRLNQAFAPDVRFPLDFFTEKPHIVSRETKSGGTPVPPPFHSSAKCFLTCSSMCFANCSTQCSKQRVTNGRLSSSI